jgi:hypothetical protein
MTRPVSATMATPTGLDRQAVTGQDFARLPLSPHAVFIVI